MTSLKAGIKLTLPLLIRCILLFAVVARSEDIAEDGVVSDVLSDDDFEDGSGSGFGDGLDSIDSMMSLINTLKLIVSNFGLNDDDLKGFFQLLAGADMSQLATLKSQLMPLLKGATDSPQLGELLRNLSAVFRQRLGDGRHSDGDKSVRSEL